MSRMAASVAARIAPMDGIFSDDFRPAPYWWDRSPLAGDQPPPLPARVDVAVIGSGYTGLHAALQVARAGRSVAVLDAGPLGSGCSTRNGGQISTAIKPDLATLARRHGVDIARAIIADGRASRAFVERFVKEERIDCDFRVCGRFHGAVNARAFGAMERLAKEQNAGEAPRISLVPPDCQRREIGSDIYHGGIVIHDHACLDPARFHAGLLERVRATGTLLCAGTPVTGLTPETDGVALTTAKGKVRAGHVVLATNGYSGALSPWHQRRIVPIGSYMIATEPLPAALVDELLPTGRIVSDSRRVVYYYRASPDRRRILFGGRVSAGETDTRDSARRLYRDMLRIFPQIEGYRISHSWMGFVGYTFDTLPHIGSRDRVHHAMGYCGSGVGMACYLGMKTGLGLLGKTNDGTCGLAETRFQTRPLYRGRPWFVPAAVEIYRALDRAGL